MVIDPSIDQGVELSLFQTGTYEKGILNYISKNFNEDGHFVDVGANIGLMSLYVATHFPNARITAFEAHPNTAVLLKDNLVLNNVQSVQVINKALGAENGQIELFENWDVNRGGASIKLKSDTSKSYKVDLIKLDEIEGLEPTCIKIDVEGAELDVIQGALTIIQQYKPTLIIEVSKNRLEEAGTREMYDLICDMNIYDIFKLKGSKERKSGLEKVLDYNAVPAHDNIICIPKGK